MTEETMTAIGCLTEEKYRELRRERIAGLKKGLEEEKGRFLGRKKELAEEREELREEYELKKEDLSKKRGSFMKVFEQTGKQIREVQSGLPLLVTSEQLEEMQRARLECNTILDGDEELRGEYDGLIESHMENARRARSIRGKELVYRLAASSQGVREVLKFIQVSAEEAVSAEQALFKAYRRAVETVAGILTNRMEKADWEYNLKQKDIDKKEKELPVSYSNARTALKKAAARDNIEKLLEVKIPSTFIPSEGEQCSEEEAREEVQYDLSEIEEVLLSGLQSLWGWREYPEELQLCTSDEVKENLKLLVRKSVITENEANAISLLYKAGLDSPASADIVPVAPIETIVEKKKPRYQPRPREAPREEEKTELALINEALARDGFDPDIVHAYLAAFRPGTRNFIGEHTISEFTMFKNMRPYLEDGKRAQAGKELRRLVNLGLILRNGLNAYSLNPHASEIKSPPIRRALEYRTRSRSK